MLLQLFLLSESALATSCRRGVWNLADQASVDEGSHLFFELYPTSDISRESLLASIGLFDTSLPWDPHLAVELVVSPNLRVRRRRWMHGRYVEAWPPRSLQAGAYFWVWGGEPTIEFDVSGDFVASKRPREKVTEVSTEWTSLELPENRDQCGVHPGPYLRLSFVLEHPEGAVVEVRVPGRETGLEPLTPSGSEVVFRVFDPASAIVFRVRFPDGTKSSWVQVTVPARPSGWPS